VEEEDASATDLWDWTYFNSDQRCLLDCGGRRLYFHWRDVFACCVCVSLSNYTFKEVNDLQPSESETTNKHAANQADHTAADPIMQSKLQPPMSRRVCVCVCVRVCVSGERAEAALCLTRRTPRLIQWKHLHLGVRGAAGLYSPRRSYYLCL